MSIWIGLFRPFNSDIRFLDSLHRGNTIEAIRQAHAELELIGSANPRCVDIQVLLFRMEMLFGSEQAAEEMMPSMGRAYARHQRPRARWLGRLDAAFVAMARRRFGRAGELLGPFMHSDPPEDLRIEGLVLLARCLWECGDVRAARHVVQDVSKAGDFASAPLHARMAYFACLEFLNDGPVSHSDRLPVQFDLMNKHLRWVIGLTDTLQSPRDLHAALHDYQSSCALWRARLWAEEAQVAAGMRLIAGGAYSLAKLALNGLLENDARLRSHVSATSLLNCKSALLAVQGRFSEALEVLQLYVVEYERNLRRDLRTLPRLPLSSGHSCASDHGISSQLPPRYRRLIPFLMERMSDPHLSVREMAAFLNVSERALQLTCRDRLGMTPMALLRQMRTQGLHHDLQQAMPGDAVAVTARRSGLGERERLVKSLRLEGGAPLGVVVE